MRSLYLSLAALALTLDLSDAIGSSGLLRERKEEHHRQLQTSKSSKSKGSKGKSSSSTLSPVCPGDSSSSSSKGKGGKGSKSKSTNRFLEEVRQLNGKGKGKGKSSGSDECDCDYPTDLCEDEEPEQVVCGQILTEDTVLSTSLGCPLGTAAGETGWALTVDGATLECTGDGDNMVYSTNDGLSDDTACVILRNGATLKNCHIYNCPVGVYMQGVGNNRVVGSTFFGNGANVETGPSNVIPSPNPQPAMHEGCYSIECSKLVGGMVPQGGNVGMASVLVRHGGNMIISNTDILGSMQTGVRIWPAAGSTLAVAFEDTNIFGSQMSDDRNYAIQLGDGNANNVPFGAITEVGFYGQTKLVAHLYGIIQSNAGGAGTPSIVVYGDLESYDSYLDNYQLLDAALMLEDGSELIACNSNQDPIGNAGNLPPNGVSIDLQPTALSRFVDMGGDIFCDGMSSVPCDANTCTLNPQTAFSCSGDGGSASKSKGKGGKGSKSKSSTP